MTGVYLEEIVQFNEKIINITKSMWDILVLYPIITGRFYSHFCSINFSFHNVSPLKFGHPLRKVFINRNGGRLLFYILAQPENDIEN